MQIVVTFLSDQTGSTHPLSLPDPKTAYVHAGMVVEQGTPAEVFGAPKHERTKAFLASVSGH